ncbi:MAG: helix-hairpin-helix domain-containing protein [Crocinitomicaceae bacterium]|nr:helix-hairpin-helix domain-containing protein [Crocinitomicaceae bacterium]
MIWLLTLGLIIAYSPRIISGILSTDAPIISHELILEAHTEIVENEEQRSQEEMEPERTKYLAPSSKFDPNTYSISDWLALGLSERQAEVVVNFSQRGLKSNEDLKMIFVFPTELYDLIKDSTIYPLPEVVNYDEGEVYTFDLVEINSANEIELDKIPGIGEFYAIKIVEYREQLGGYIGREQLLEIWKFDQAKLDEITEYIYLEPRVFTKINISTASVEELKEHPYITYSVANSIVKMRAQGNFETIQDIQRSKLIDQELMTRLIPYLTIE